MGALALLQPLMRMLALMRVLASKLANPLAMGRHPFTRPRRIELDWIWLGLVWDHSNLDRGALKLIVMWG